MSRRLNRNEALTQRVREKYLPQVLADNPTLKPTDVLWIGPLSDGLVKLGVFTRRVGTDKGRWQGNQIPDYSFKSFVLLAIRERGETALGSADAALGFKRGDGPLVDLSPRSSTEAPIRDNEPGEIVNSPKMREEAPGQATEEFDPIIRIDKRFGLHCLLRGDYFIKRIRQRRGRETGREYVWEYRLRSPEEGSSLVVPTKQPDAMQRF